MASELVLSSPNLLGCRYVDYGPLTSIVVASDKANTLATVFFDEPLLATFSLTTDDHTLNGQGGGSNNDNPGAGEDIYDAWWNFDASEPSEGFTSGDTGDVLYLSGVTTSGFQQRLGGESGVPYRLTISGSMDFTPDPGSSGTCSGTVGLWVGTPADVVPASAGSYATGVDLTASADINPGSFSLALSGTVSASAGDYMTLTSTLIGTSSGAANGVDFAPSFNIYQREVASLPYLRQTISLPGRPTAMLSFKPSSGTQYVYVIYTVGTGTRPQPYLRSYSISGASLVEGTTVTLDAEADPHVLWAPGFDKADDADFIVVSAGRQGLQVRDATGAMAVRTTMQGVGYWPRAIDVVHRSDLERAISGVVTADMVYDIRLFNGTGAVGSIVRYNKRTASGATKHTLSRITDFDAYSVEGPVRAFHLTASSGESQDTLTHTVADLAGRQQVTKWSFADDYAPVRTTTTDFYDDGLNNADRLIGGAVVGHTEDAQTNDGLTSVRQRPRDRAIYLTGIADYITLHADLGKIVRVIE